MIRISVFGGSRTQPGQGDYEQALHLGQLLGDEGYTVLTGGYIGTMEAVSRGAAERGGRVIGVTCDEIEAWRPVRPNPWVQEEKRFATLRQRMFALIEEGDAIIALPGGPGTLAEISVAWTHLLTEAITPRPLILVGQGWQATFNQFYISLGPYIPEAQRRWLTHTIDVESTVAQLKTYTT